MGQPDVRRQCGLEVGLGGDRREVHDGVDPGDGGVERGVVGGQVGHDDPISPRLVGPDAVETPRVVPGRRQPGHQHPPDAPRRPGDEDVHRSVVGDGGGDPTGRVDVLVDHVEHDLAAGFDSFICPTAWPTK